MSKEYIFVWNIQTCWQEFVWKAMENVSDIWTQAGPVNISKITERYVCTKIGHLFEKYTFRFLPDMSAPFATWCPLSKQVLKIKK